MLIKTFFWGISLSQSLRDVARYLEINICWNWFFMYNKSFWNLDLPLHHFRGITHFQFFGFVYIYFIKYNKRRNGSLNIET